MAAKPEVIVLGGCGFLGRNLVHYLVTNDLTSKIRVVDKVLPDTAYLDAAMKESFAAVEYMQGNLVNEGSIRKCFTQESGQPFTYCFNLAGETKFGQQESVYQEKVLDLSRKCANIAKETGVTRFIEVSTGQVYDGDKKAAKEDSKLKPWTNIAEYKKQAEDALKAIDGMDIIFVRPAVCYGPGDIAGITPRFICGAVYKQLDEKMEFLWSADLKINTVHARDVAKALWHLTSNGNNNDVFNLADKSNSSQGSINQFIEKTIGIKTGFMGSIKSQAAKAWSMKDTAEYINEKHLKPWSDLCKAAGIDNTPLTPYLDEELLRNNHVSIDGTAIEATGFTYDHPVMTEELIREQLAYFTSQGIFPETVLIG